LNKGNLTKNIVVVVVVVCDVSTWTTMNRNITHVTVLGGGLTGLTTAYRLARLLKDRNAVSAGSNVKITLLEKADRLGGWVHSQKRTIKVPSSVRKDTGATEEVDVVLERGPRSIRPKGGIGAAYMLKLVSSSVGSTIEHSRSPL
jgi:protoporphyrinogen oxidase